MAVTEHKAQGLVSVACFVLAVSDTRSVDTDSSDRAFATCSRARGTPLGHAIVRDEPVQVAAVRVQLAETARRRSSRQQM